MTYALSKFLGKFTLAAALIATVGIAQADGWRWRTGFPLSPTGSLDARGNHFDDGSNNYAAVTAARNELYNGIKSNLSTFLQPEFQKVEGYQSSSITVKGPMQLSLTPNGSATPTVGLSTFSVAITVVAKKSFGPISSTCTITVDSGALNLNGNLDVVNGSINNLTITSFVPSTARDCSSNISWIPVIGSLVDNFANSKVDGLLSKGLSAAMGASHRVFDPIKFAGLDVSIPAGRYVVKEVNFDAGQYVVNNLKALISTTPVSVRFSPPLPTLYSPSTYVDPSTTTRYIQRDEAFSISFPSAPYGGIRFAVYDNTWFNSFWECKPMKPVCAPPNTQ